MTSRVGAPEEAESTAGGGGERLGSTITWTLLRQLTGAVIALGTSVFLARSLGAQAYGTYTVALLLPTMLGIFLELGVGPANVYFIGRRSISYGDLVRWNLTVWLGVSAAGLAVGIGATLWAAEALFPGVPAPLLLLALAAFPAFLLRTYAASILQGVQDFRHFNQLALITPGITLVAALALVGLVGFGARGAVAAFVIGSVLSCVYGVVRVGRLQRFDAHQIVEGPVFRRRHLTYGSQSHVSNVLSFVNYRADIFLVNLLLNPAAVGVYVIAVQLAEKLWMLSQSASVVVLPKLTRLQTEVDGAAKLTSLVARWIFLLTTLVALVIALLGRPVVTLLFGAQFEAAATALVWLLPGIVLGGTARILANDLAARGRPELNMYTAAVVVALNVVLSIILIPPMGILGAALATTLAYAANAAIKIVLYVRLSGGRAVELFVPQRGDWEIAAGLLRRLRR